MSAITVSATAHPNYHGGGATATVKIFCDRSFLASDGTRVWKSRLGGPVWYLIIPCTVAGTTLNIPSFTIDSTEDSDNPKATFSALLYNSSGNQVDVLFKKWHVPSSLGSSISFAQLVAFNAQPVSYKPGLGYTQEQVNAIVAASLEENWSLKFDGNKQHHIKVGPFFTPLTSYASSPCFTEAWIKPGNLTGARYWIAQGWGPGHVLLFGVTDAPDPNRVLLTGDFDPANAYNSADTLPRNAWSHVAMLYLPANYLNPGIPATASAYTFINGVLSSITPLTSSPRASSGGLGTGGNGLMIGAYAHSNFDGYISQLRHWEGSVPFLYDFGFGLPKFAPERSLRGGSYQPSNAVRADVSLCYDLRQRTGRTIRDLGVGFNGRTHSGVLSSGYDSDGLLGEPDNYETNLPTWVRDAVSLSSENIATPVIPPTAILYDSFMKQDKTPASEQSLISLGLGNLEKGGAWLGSPSVYGIINRRAFGVPDGVYPVFAEVGQSDMDVQIKSGDTNPETLPAVFAKSTGVDANNCLFMYRIPGYIYTQELNSVGTAIQNTYHAFAGGTDLLRIEVDGTTAKYYAGNTLLETFTGITRTGTKAGFFAVGIQRVDEFAVYG